jgi:hypothetical protein
LSGEGSGAENYFRHRFSVYSFNQWFPFSSNNAHSQCSQSSRIIRFDYLRRREHGVILADVRRVLGGLLDGFHLFLATSMV